MDRIIFGDNQFFGINHMSEEKARKQSQRFNDTQSIIDVINDAYECGLKTFMCTTHDRIAEICQHIRANPAYYKDFEIYPCMPYAHKYANAVTDFGISGTLQRYLPGNLFLTILRGGIAVAKKDFISMMKMLIDMEMKMFFGIQTRVIFLQNILTDLLMGLNFYEVFYQFAEYVKSKYDAEPGFITMNMPRLLDILEQIGIHNPIICSSINKVGFRMCGGIKRYEDTIAEREFRPIAMSIMASGAIRPDEAVKYIAKQNNIRSILFGASSKDHIRETRDLIVNHYEQN